MLSTSSMNRMQGALRLACSKVAFIAASTSPRCEASNHLATDVAIKGTPRVLQSALANVVLPVPGGPESSSRELRSDQATSLFLECFKISLEIKRPSLRIAITCQPLNEQADLSAGWFGRLFRLHARCLVLTSSFL
jgi:hypothetical protein